MYERIYVFHSHGTAPHLPVHRHWGELLVRGSDRQGLHGVCAVHAYRVSLTPGIFNKLTLAGLYDIKALETVGKESMPKWKTHTVFSKIVIVNISPATRGLQTSTVCSVTVRCTRWNTARANMNISM